MKKFTGKNTAHYFKQNHINKSTRDKLQQWLPVWSKLVIRD